MFLVRLWRTSLSFGTIGAVLGVAMFLLLSLLDENPLNKGKYFDFLLMLLILWFGMKYLKDYENNGNLRFIQGIGWGLMSSLILGTCSSVFLAVYLSYVDPEVLVQYKEIGIQYLDQNKDQVLKEIGETTYLKTLQELESISVQDVVVDDILRKLIIGLFLSTILAVFLRSKIDHGST